MTAKEPPAKKAKKETKKKEPKKDSKKKEETEETEDKTEDNDATTKTDASDWKDHKMNIEDAIVKSYEGCSFNELAKSNIQVLQGIGPKSDMILEAMKLETVQDLADYKYFKIAHAIKTLAETEGPTRLEGSKMNADHALDKEYEAKTLKEILEAPTSALQGLTGAADSLLGSIGIKTVGDLASCKYFHWAQAICTIAKYEEQHTASERKVSRAAKKLS